MRVGIDILENNRIINIYNDEKRMSKIFTVKEIAYFNKFSDKISHICGAFCAKEAFVKALKTGFTKELTPIDVEILHTESGIPYVNIDNLKIKKLINKEDKIDINISHSDTISTAICIIYS